MDLTSAFQDYAIHRMQFIHDHMHKIKKPDPVYWGEYVYDILFGEMTDTPTNPLYLYETINTYSIAGYTPGLHNSLLGYFTLRFVKARYWPRFDRIGNLAKMPPAGGPFIVELLDNPVWYELRDAVKDYDEAVKKNNLKRICILRFINEFCSRYNTINEAVAAWPAFRYLLPDSLQGWEYSFDGTPKPLPEGVDVAELTALITRAKLMEV